MDNGQIYMRIFPEGNLNENKIIFSEVEYFVQHKIRVWLVELN